MSREQLVGQLPSLRRYARVLTGDAWAAEHRLSVYTPVIVKYRDDRTDTRTELEAWIR